MSARAMLYAAMQEAVCEADKALRCSAQCCGTRGLEQQAAFELGRMEAHALAAARMARVMVATVDMKEEKGGLTDG